MRFGSLFSGIGGLDLGLERAGMSVAWQCEIEPYCRAVLAHHWPGVVCYDDIRSIDDTAERVDLICGGFPCQPVSVAGRGLAQEDPRWLWPEFARVVGLLRPRYVLVENVPGLVRRGLSDVIGDLAALGYDAEWQVVSAAAVGAPHLRERIFVVAHSRGRGPMADSGCLSGPTRGDPGDLACSTRAAQGVGEEWQWGRDAADDRGADVADANGLLLDWVGAFRTERRPEPSDGSAWLPEPEVGRVADGVPDRVAQLRALGNAVVPQVAEFVGRLILEAEGVTGAV